MWPPVLRLLADVYMLNRLGWYPSTSVLPYRTEHHRTQRRWIWSMFGDKRTLRNLDCLKTRETCTFLMGLMETPDKLALHVKRCVVAFHHQVSSTDERCDAIRLVSALVLESVYGHRIASLDDPFVTMMDEAMEATTASATVGGSLVDLLPSCEYTQ